MPGGTARGRAPLSWPPGAAAAAIALVLCMWWLRRRFLRYEVAGSSMSPTLRPGDFVVVDRRAFAHRAPARGDVILIRDPREPGRTLVKRVANVDLHGSLWVLGDNPEQSTDSRAFGAVAPGTVLGRVRWRYWPPGALSRARQDVRHRTM